MGDEPQCHDGVLDWTWNEQRQAYHCSGCDQWLALARSEPTENFMAMAEAHIRLFHSPPDFSLEAWMDR